MLAISSLSSVDSSLWPEPVLPLPRAGPPLAGLPLPSQYEGPPMAGPPSAGLPCPGQCVVRPRRPGLSHLWVLLLLGEERGVCRLWQYTVPVQVLLLLFFSLTFVSLFFIRIRSLKEIRLQYRCCCSGFCFQLHGSPTYPAYTTSPSSATAPVS